MTVAVLGPGAVGGALAVPLALSDVRVVCVARSDTAKAIARDGVTLRRRGDELHARPVAVDELRERVDLLLITVKAPALDDALARIDSGAEAVVPLLNGIEHVEAIRNRLGNRVIAGSVGRLEAYREGPTTIVQTTESLAVMLASGADRQTVKLLRLAGADISIDGDERAVLWEKLVRQAPLAAATALAQLPVGELRADPEWRETLQKGVAEACAVAAADGVDLKPDPQWEIIDAMPAGLTTSTARDVAAGRPSELDAITGAVVRAGARLDIPTPTLERLLAEAEERCQARSR